MVPCPHGYKEATEQIFYIRCTLTIVIISLILDPGTFGKLQQEQKDLDGFWLKIKMEDGIVSLYHFSPPVIVRKKI